MPDIDHRNSLFPALLKHWRRQHGLSQLDLALAADVSARHVSFLETGRSVPSIEMVLVLGTTLGVPLRQINTLLRAAGHPAVYDEDDALPGSIVEALELLKLHHEPFPVIVVDRAYRVRDLNRGAVALLATLLGWPIPDLPLDLEAVKALGLNLARMTFDPALVPHLVNFEELGRALLWRIQREALDEPHDHDVQRLLEDLLSSPTVPEAWRTVDLSEPSEPALVVHLRIGDDELRFLTTITAFQAPQNIAVEQLRIETWFPYDAATAAACRALG